MAGLWDRGATREEEELHIRQSKATEMVGHMVRKIKRRMLIIPKDRFANIANMNAGSGK